MELVRSFLEYLAADKGYSIRTIQTYERDLKNFNAFFGSLEGGLDWKTVDSDVIRRWMVLRMEQSASPRTMKRSLSALRSFYRYLMARGETDRDPVRKVQNPKAGKPLPVFVKEKEIDRLFDVVEFPPGFEGCRDRLILLMFYTTGVRVSELVGLDMENLDNDVRELKVTGKRNKQRIIPYGAELAECLGEYFSRRNVLPCGRRGALFVKPDGRRLSVREVRETVKKYLSLVTSQKKRGPHVLRHTFATVMLNNGADLEAVKELLGHESLATTEIYTHTTFAELKKEYEHAHPRA